MNGWLPRGAWVNYELRLEEAGLWSPVLQRYSSFYLPPHLSQHKSQTKVSSNILHPVS